MKRDKIVLFQCLLSGVLIAIAGLASLGLLASARLSERSKMGPLEVSRNLILADHAQWNQFYDAVVGLGRTPEVTQPADAPPENRAAGDGVDVVNVPTTTRISADQVPSPSIAPAATTTSPVVPSESGPPAVAHLHVAEPVPTLDANADKSAQWKRPPAALPAPLPRAKVAAPVPPVHRAARVKQAASEPERDSKRGRPARPARARVALPGQRYAPQSQWDGTQWVDPQHQQHQSGALSYAPPQYNAQPPGGPRFGPYFPYGSRPPSAQRSGAQQDRSPQPF